jgi:hypothetical protein
MAFETFPKSGQHGKGKKFDTCMYPAGWDDADNGKRDRMKSGRNEYCAKAQNNYKFKSGKEAPGNTSRREYPKQGNKYQNGFGTGA